MEKRGNATVYFPFLFQKFSRINKSLDIIYNFAVRKRMIRKTKIVTL